MLQFGHPKNPPNNLKWQLSGDSLISSLVGIIEPIKGLALLGLLMGILQSLQNLPERDIWTKPSH